MNRRDASKTETRELILRAARKLFLEKGVDQCTMRGIAGAAGVSPASVVVHFKNKNVLLEVAMYEDINTAISQAVAAMPTDEDLLGRFMFFARSMYTFYSGNRELYRIVIRNTLFEPPSDLPHLTQLNRQLDKYLYEFAGDIDREKQKGTVRADANAITAARAFFNHYICVLGVFLRSPDMKIDAALALLYEVVAQHLTGILLNKEG